MRNENQFVLEKLKEGLKRINLEALIDMSSNGNIAHKGWLAENMASSPEVAFQWWLKEKLARLPGAGARSSS